MLHYFRKKLPRVSEEELSARIEETLKFLTIANECRSAIPVSPEVDEIWHYWILQTKQYEKLCRLLPSGEFIHHSSNDYTAFLDENVGTGDGLALDVRMLAIYVANFGPFAPDRVKYWILAAHLVESRGWTVAQLNEWLVPVAA